MQNLNQSEVNSIREIVSGHQTIACKLNDYANQCQDPQFKQAFEKAAQEANKSAQNLIEML